LDKIDIVAKIGVLNHPTAICKSMSTANSPDDYKAVLFAIKISWSAGVSAANSIGSSPKVGADKISASYNMPLL
jgi:hypothetical protein